MSRKKTTTKKKNDQAAAATEDATFDSDTEQTAPQKNRGGMVAWLALLVALLALVVYGIDFVADRDVAVASRESDAASAAMASAMRAMQDSVVSLQQNVTTLSDQIAARDSEIAAIERGFADRLRQIESLPGRMSTIEGSVSALQGISTGARDAWLLAEAEYYMQIANAQLQLAGNPRLASLALRLADERILQLANPALIDIRRALSFELRALEVMDKPDTAGLTLTLASLAAVVDSLPLRQEIAMSQDNETVDDTELTGTDRALASLKNAMDRAISVRRVDESVKPLIAPEAQYFLRANLALQLQAARLAILRGDETIFQHSLDDAATWLTEYYDTDGSAVRSALQTIAEIRDSVFSVSLPDISESLRLLRQFNAMANAVAAPVIEPVIAPVAEPPQ